MMPCRCNSGSVASASQKDFADSGDWKSGCESQMSRADAAGSEQNGGKCGAVSAAESNGRRKNKAQGGAGSGDKKNQFWPVFAVVPDNTAQNGRRCCRCRCCCR